MEADSIVSLAHEHGLEVISITDHDTIGAYPKARKAGSSLNVDVLPGVELTCEFNERESHLLAYCFDVEDGPLNAMLLKQKKARLERIDWIVGQLTRQGLELDREEVRAEAGTGNVGRPHVAAVLRSKGYVGSIKEAFIRYLGNHVLGPIPGFYISHGKAVRMVKEAGGAVILAHPGHLYTEKELQQWIDAGLDGIEVIHPSHNYKLQKRYEQFAGRNNLLITGGSDFHGRDDRYLRYFGIVNIGLEKVHKLKRLTEQRKQISV